MPIRINTTIAEIDTGPLGNGPSESNDQRVASMIPTMGFKSYTGSQASGTSKEMELKLTNVARASLEELLEDYRDYLRVRQLPLWPKDSREALYVRKLGATQNSSYEPYRSYLETRPAAVVANILICLIHQTNYLLDQQLRQLEQDFLRHGGLRERMTRSRLRQRRA